MPKFDEVKDSGERSEFSTGAIRDAQGGKGRYDLLPSYAIHRLARHFENGARKYSENNWRKGIPLRRYLDSMGRHFFKLIAGADDEDHGAALAWNILCYLETEEMIKRGMIKDEKINDLDPIQSIYAEENGGVPAEEEPKEDETDGSPPST